MRQHVNPLSSFFQDIEPIPPLREIFNKPTLNLHIDIGSASGDFLFKLARENKNWNYLGIEIREKLVINANLKLKEQNLDNLFFVYGNASNLIEEAISNFPKDALSSVSFNFPDPWFKKKHHKRRVVQPELIKKIAELMPSGALLFIKSDVYDLFQFMDFVIINSLIFKKYDFSKSEIIRYFNPSNIKTSREDYAISKNLKVYEQTYQKYI